MLIYALRMINKYDAETLLLHVANIEAKKEALTEAVEGRDEQIRGMLRKGAMPTELGNLIGMTRARIYQIRDGRR